MTDNEIVKGLQSCICYRECSQCPFNSGAAGTSECISECMDEAFGLINRQKAKIKKLKEENKILTINADNAFQDGLDEAKDLYSHEIKAEAVKEFAAKVKKEIEDALKSNYKVKREHTEKYCNSNGYDELMNYCNGKIDCLRGLQEFIDDLIKERIRAEQ